MHGYDLGDTQDGLKCWRMGFIFCGKHPLLLTRIKVSDLVFVGISFRSPVLISAKITDHHI